MITNSVYQIVRTQSMDSTMGFQTKETATTTDIEMYTVKVTVEIFAITILTVITLLGFHLSKSVTCFLQRNPHPLKQLVYTLESHGAKVRAPKLGT